MTVTASPAAVLALPMNGNDADAATVGDYLIALLAALWRRREGFGGKRPFGNSDWEFELCQALVDGGLIEGATVNDGGWIEDLLDPALDAADAVIAAAILALKPQ